MREEERGGRGVEREQEEGRGRRMRGEWKGERKDIEDKLFESTYPLAVLKKVEDLATPVSGEHLHRPREYSPTDCLDPL